MFEEHDLYKVYVKTDAAGRITAINSDAFISSLEGWQEIDSGSGDKYHHAQGNYLGSLYDERGLLLYKLVNGKPAKRGAAEIEADYTPPAIVPSQEERIAQLEAAMIALIEGATE